MRYEHLPDLHWLNELLELPCGHLFHHYRRIGTEFVYELRGGYLPG